MSAVISFLYTLEGCVSPTAVRYNLSCVGVFCVGVYLFTYVLVYLCICVLWLTYLQHVLYLAHTSINSRLPAPTWTRWLMYEQVRCSGVRILRVLADTHVLH